MDKTIRPGVKAVVVHSRRMLVMKRGSDVPGAGLWEFPGGGMEFGESVMETLERELREEAGLEAQVREILSAHSFLTGPQRQLVVIYYRAESPSDRVRLSDEHGDYCWADLATARRLLHPPIVEDFERSGLWEKMAAYID